MKKLFKWIGIVFGGFVVLVIVAGIFGSKTPAGNSSANEAQAANAAPAAPRPTPVAVTASALFDAYDSNEVAADQKYKGKLLAVSGSVQSIDKDAFNNIVVTLKTRNEFMPVHAYLGKEYEAVAASLSKGQKISWECNGDGKIIGSPIIRECNPKT